MSEKHKCEIELSHLITLPQINKLLCHLNCGGDVKCVHIQEINSNKYIYTKKIKIKNDGLS